MVEIDMEKQDNTIDLRAFLVKVLRKWRWFVVSLAVCGCVGLAYYMTSLSQYQVDAVFQIRSGEDAVSLPSSDMLQMFGFGGTKQIDDELNIISSRDLLVQVIKELDIQTVYLKRLGGHWVNQYGKPAELRVDYPEMFLDTTKAVTLIDIKVRKHDYAVKVKTRRFHVYRFTVKDFSQPLRVPDVGEIRITPLKVLNRGDSYRIVTSNVLAVAKAYNQAITVAKVKKESAMVRLSTVTTNVRLAKDFINKQIEIYNRNSIIDKKLMANATALFIEERLNLIAKELASAEEEVEQYKKDNNLTAISAQAEIYLTENVEYRHKLEALETQEKLVSYVESYVKDESKQTQLIPANLGIEDAALGLLISDYNTIALRRLQMQRAATADNPVVQNLDDQMRVMRENILTSIRSVKNSLAIQKRDLNEQASKTDEFLATVPTKEREFIERSRNKEIQQKLYLYLYQKREENAFSLVTAVPPAHLISSAQADPSRMSPRLSTIVLICLVLGLGFPVVWIYLQEILNNKIQDRKQLAQYSKLPFAGELLLDSSGDAVVIGDGVDTPVAEMIRLLRTNIVPQLPALPARTKGSVMMVTSCTEGEGKSYVALNLAVAFALLNKRVALVELNMRHPSIAETLGMPTGNGVTHYLDDKALDYEDIAVSSHLNANLDIFPAGVIPANPSELLQSDRLDTLFGDLRKKYDYIIVDAAPTATVSDAFIVNRVCDATLFVSRIDYTTFDMIAYANELVAKQRLNNPLAVLNGVEKTANAQFDLARK